MNEHSSIDFVHLFSIKLHHGSDNNSHIGQTDRLNKLQNKRDDKSDQYCFDYDLIRIPRGFKRFKIQTIHQNAPPNQH